MTLGKLETRVSLGVFGVVSMKTESTLKGV
jgi:hypothetical protein